MCKWNEELVYAIKEEQAEKDGKNKARNETKGDVSVELSRHLFDKGGGGRDAWQKKKAEKEAEGRCKSRKSACEGKERLRDKRGRGGERRQEKDEIRGEGKSKSRKIARGKVRTSRQ